MRRIRGMTWHRHTFQGRRRYKALFVHCMGRSPRVRGGGCGNCGVRALRTAVLPIRRTRRIFQPSGIASSRGSLNWRGEDVAIGHSLGGVLLRAAVLALPAGVRRPRRFFDWVRPCRHCSWRGVLPIIRCSACSLATADKCCPPRHAWRKSARPACRRRPALPSPESSRQGSRRRGTPRPGLPLARSAGRVGRTRNTGSA